jgi:hypothetical protein
LLPSGSPLFANQDSEGWPTDRLWRVDAQANERTSEARWPAPHPRSLKSLASGNHATIQRGTNWHTKINTNAGGQNMQIAPEITFEGSESSDAARAQILGELERLETIIIVLPVAA